MPVRAVKMREKTLRFVVTFYTTAEAMATEKLCKEQNIAGKLISAPRSVSADCGIAFSADISLKDIVREAIENKGIEVQDYYELML